MCHVFYIWLPFRLNNVQVQNEFLKQIPQLADLSAPTNHLDWKSKQISAPPNAKDVTKLAGRRDGSFGAANVPHYMLVRNADQNQRHMGILDRY